VADAAPAPATHPSHLYGGQAVVEGVMMRGSDHWAVAVRRPDAAIHVESHEIRSIAKRHPLLAKPFFRGIIVLGQSVAIGTRALMIASNKSVAEDQQLTKRETGIALAVAMTLFIAIFIVGPTALFHWFRTDVGGGRWTNVLEGVFRIVLFVGYLWIIACTSTTGRSTRRSPRTSTATSWCPNASTGTRKSTFAAGPTS
jgi:uncharacterized protein YqhQ